MSISDAKNVCDREREKDSIGGQNAQGAKSWPRQSKSFASAQAEGMAAAVAPAQCPSGTSGSTGLSHLALAHEQWKSLIILLGTGKRDICQQCCCSIISTSQSWDSLG